MKAMKLRCLCWIAPLTQILFFPIHINFHCIWHTKWNYHIKLLRNSFTPLQLRVRFFLNNLKFALKKCMVPNEIFNLQWSFGFCCLWTFVCFGKKPIGSGGALYEFKAFSHILVKYLICLIFLCPGGSKRCSWQVSARRCAYSI